MQANGSLSPSIAPVRETSLNLERLDREAESPYWLRFLNGRWLIYWHERLIGDFPAENAALALAFLRQKQGERPALG
ncbi:MAG TPA: hypothetical protein VGL83_18725 [Stellaceae bacterium]|jgi:hypothetical protein